MSTATEAPFVAPTASQPNTDPEGISPPAEVDLVEVAKLAIYATRGWTRQDKNGKTVPDDEPTKNFVYELFRDNVVVDSDADIVEDGLSAADLYAKTFPSTPGASSDPRRRGAVRGLQERRAQVVAVRRYARRCAVPRTG